MYSSEADLEWSNGLEYGKSQPHNYVKSNQQRDVYMVSNAENKICQSVKYQNKQVQVTLEFPEQSDQKAEQEFVSRLKTMYLENIKIGAMQKENLALSSSPIKEKEENNNE